MNESPDRDERHLARMLRKKAVIDERIASAPNECGLLLVLTGNGKGKSSSAFGMLARAMGHGPWHAVRRGAIYQGPQQHRRGAVLPALPRAGALPCDGRRLYLGNPGPPARYRRRRSRLGRFPGNAP
ncbi:Cob(I)alamin adenosyltransferase [Pseudomonas batumici]|uniref:corrinoid adenosyltransferase n=1 Tax=Pseudomonas batumici TaxID=226910 RepID=A0A0C2EUG7_9PSED|nr:Cob(I)alamin adenosyltransferase [Pseudomonas batumici]